MVAAALVSGSIAGKLPKYLAVSVCANVLIASAVDLDAGRGQHPGTRPGALQVRLRMAAAPAPALTPLPANQRAAAAAPAPALAPAAQPLLPGRQEQRSAPPPAEEQQSPPPADMRGVSDARRSAQEAPEPERKPAQPKSAQPQPAQPKPAQPGSRSLVDSKTTAIRFEEEKKPAPPPPTLAPAREQQQVVLAPSKQERSTGLQATRGKPGKPGQPGQPKQERSTDPQAISGHPGKPVQPRQAVMARLLPALPPPAAEEQLSAQVHEARYRRRSAPVYPSRALELGQQGTVMLHARVARTGLPDEMKVVESSGHRLLDMAALAAVRKWEFEPMSRDGAAIASWVRVPVHFVIQQ